MRDLTRLIGDSVTFFLAMLFYRSDADSLIVRLGYQ